MTIREALQWARGRLQGSPTPHVDARLLLQYVLQVAQPYLAAHPELSLTHVQMEQFRNLVSRAEKSEPIPYITGETVFYGLDFLVTPDVLIPRPETEHLVQTARDWAASHRVRRIVDVGTGSGCIAVALAHHLPAVEVLAVDVSSAALEVARHNVRRHGLEKRIRLLQGTLLEKVEQSIDLVAANLPYISDAEWTVLDDGVKWYEPAGALRGGPDGLDFIRRLLQQARPLLRPSGAIFLEIGWRQGKSAMQLAQTFYPTARVTLKQDYAGHDRLVIIETRNETI
jgi:release factor glutamine methyltransferase